MDLEHSVGLTRRAFVRGLGAAVLAPHIIPAAALGADGNTAPSETITMGLIGCGGQGRGVMGGALQQKGTRVVAVCDVNANNMAEAKKMLDEHYGNSDCATYRDYRELLARDDIDAVIIATPDHWHALVSVAAANAGKDIYCEKPLTWSLGEGRAVCEAVKKNKVVFQVGSMQRSGGQFKQACELVRNGYLGKIKHINVALPNGNDAKWVDEYPAPPPHLDYDFYVGPAEWTPYHPDRLDWNWRWWMGFGGSQMMDWIGHHGDIAHMGMGWDDSGPVEIEPVLWEMPEGRNNLYNAAGKYLVNYKYEGGVTMQLASFNEMPQVFKDCGDTGTQWFGDDGKWVYVSRKGIQASDKELLKIKFSDKDFRFRAQRNHMRDFLDCVRSREECIAPAEAGHRSASVGHLGKIALTLNAKLKWNPKKERFVDNEAVNSLLMRKYRGDWKLV
ncbi:MAG: Gfo/Idh/MocA family oxidoreductase [Candidatus Hydrogenedens sp.]|nr:Gfo/Idh/MocA family oxidoreductase [Candidatus Hydrogenedentota bacterium]NLF56627.1 Gfo/Idh/MocA family oxidoreductase [Candidatus Hydrogenedens sp.]